jgi:putative ABC transport system permease protein
VGFATHDFFHSLGVRISQGRGFTPSDDRRGAAPAAVLTDRYWRQAFGASPSVVGETITVAGRGVTIVGVAPAGFRGVDITKAPDLYLPLHTIAETAATGTNYFGEPSHPSAPTAGLRIFGRVLDNENAAQAATRLGGLRVTDGSEQAHLGLTPIATAAMPQTARAAMVQFGRLLTATVLLLLLVGSGTVGLLHLIRIEARRSELATCLALGASRSRVLRGLFLEAALLASVGAAVAMPLSALLLLGLRTFQLPGDVNIGLLELTINRRAVLTSLGAGAVAFVVIAGIIVTYATSIGVAGPLLAHGGTGTRVTRKRTRGLFLSGQIAVAFALLAGATLLVKSLQAGLALNPSVDMHRVLTSEISVGASGYDQARAAFFFDELHARMALAPSVEVIAFSVEQGGVGPQGSLAVDGERRSFPSIVRFNAIDPAYFRAVGLAVTSGRAFSADDGPEAPRVTIVSQSLAKLIARGNTAIGRRIEMPVRSKTKPSDVVTVVGVVPDVVLDLTLLEPLAMYFPTGQRDIGTYRTLTVRARNADGLRRDLLTTTRQIDPGVVLRTPLTLRERIDQQMGPQRLGSAVLGAFGGIALLLTVLGTYLLADSMVTLRTQEMGIRVALGATTQQVAGAIVSEMGRLVTAGLAAGLALAFLGADTLRSFLFQVQPLDPLTLGIVAAAILAVSLAAVFRPALRLARLEVARVLRHE